MFFNRKTRRRFHAGQTSSFTTTVARRDGERLENRQLMTAVSVSADTVDVAAETMEMEARDSQPLLSIQAEDIDALFTATGQDIDPNVFGEDGFDCSNRAVPDEDLAGIPDRSSTGVDDFSGNFRINNDPIAVPGIKRGLKAQISVTIRGLKGKNDPKGLYDYYWDATNVPPLKRNATFKMGPLQATEVKGRPTYTKLTGNVTVTKIQGGKGLILGTNGARDCVGVVAVNEKSGTVWIFHFTATEDPVDTLSRFNFPKGTHAAVCGGNNCWASNETLDEVRTGLKNAGVKVDGHLDRTGVYFDWDNKQWVYTSTCTPSNNLVVPN